MKNRHDDTLVISDYTYYVFEEVDKRGLQFAIPKHWRPLYRAFLKERKRRTQSNNNKKHIGDKNPTSSEEDPKAD